MNITGKILLTVLLAFVITLFSVATAGENLAKFKLLLVIKPKIELRAADYPVLGGDFEQTTIDRRKTDAIKKCFEESLPKLCAVLTDSMVLIEAVAIVSENPVRSVTYDGYADYSVYPENMQDDIQQYSTPGQYDCIQVIYNLGGRLSTTAWGFTYPDYCFSRATNYAGYCSINDLSTESEYLAGIYDSPAGVFLHEWEHTLESYYYERLKVRKSPFPGDNAGLDRGGDLCYPSINLLNMEHLLGMCHNYCTGDSLTGTGFGPQAYAYPAPHKIFGLISNPDWQPSQVLRNVNVLSNGSFENFSASTQRPSSWRGMVRDRNLATPAWRTVTDEKTEGERSLYLRANSQTLFSVSQTKTLEKEPYVLVYSIKTNNAASNAPHFDSGAGVITWENDASLSGYGAIRDMSISGTTGWQRYAMLVSPTAPDIQTQTGLSIGNRDSPFTGEVWFDDVMLIKLLDWTDENIQTSMANIRTDDPLEYSYKNGELILSGNREAFETARIYDTTGRLLQTTGIKSNRTISLYNLNRHILFVQLSGANGCRTIKLLNSR